MTPSARAVPAYDIHVYAGRRTRYCLVVFVLNEGGRIASQLVKMAPIADLVDIAIADGGSTDGVLTDDRLRAAHVRALLIKRGAGRLGAQQRMAFAWALDEGYEGIVTMDGNDKDDISAVPAFCARLDAGLDHIQGSRYAPGGRGINTPWLRHWGVRLIHAPLVSVAAGWRYTDTTNGFRAYSRRFLSDPRVQPFRDIFVGYELHYYLAIKAAQLAYRVAEIPVIRAYPATGPTPSKLTGIRGSLTVLSALLRACLHQFDPPRASSRL